MLWEKNLISENGVLFYQKPSVWLQIMQWAQAERISSKPLARAFKMEKEMFLKVGEKQIFSPKRNLETMSLLVMWKIERVITELVDLAGVISRQNINFL